MTKKARNIVLAVSVTLAAVAIGATALLIKKQGSTPRAKTNQPAPSGNNNIFLAETYQGKSLDWQAVEVILGSPTIGAEELEKLITQSEPGTAQQRYLQIVSQVATGKIEDALAGIRNLDPKDIPVSLLYLPYRLTAQSSENGSNPFRARILEAVEQGKLTPLTQARVNAIEGRYEESLMAYMDTNPALWKGADAENLNRIGLHAGLLPDLRLLLRGSLDGGRLSPRLVPELTQLFTEGPTQLATDLQSELKSRLENDPEAQKLAAQAYTAAMKDRDDFMNKRYDTLLERYREQEVTAVGNETSVMLYLAALRLDNAREIFRWNQEIKRRNPNSEITEWADSLLTTKTDQ